MIKMKFVEYAGKVWEVITPENLQWPPRVIRTIYIKRGDKHLLTNFKYCKKIMNPGSLDKFI